MNNGWAVYDTSTVPRFSNRKGFALKLNKMYSDSLTITHNCNDLDTLITVLKRHNVIPVLISAPAHPAFYNNALYKDFYYAKIHAICKKYNCRFYDYFNDTAFTRKDFYDGLHMNTIGSAKFSKLLNNDILNTK